MSKHFICKMGGRIYASFSILVLLFAMAAQHANAENTLTLEASTSMPGLDSEPEHVYVLKNLNGVYWRTDLRPTTSLSDLGQYAFYAVEGKTDAYYIYDCSAGRWLTYTVKDSYGAAQKGTGSTNYVSLSEEKNADAYFLVSSNAKSGNNGYQIELVTTTGERPVVRWYLNYYGGWDVNTDNTIGIWWHDGSRDSGSLWLLSNPPSGAKIIASTTVPDDDNRAESVYTLRNGYGSHVNAQCCPATSSTDFGHFALYEVSGVEGAYYIYDCANGKWLTYDKAVSYSECKDFVKFSDTQDAYFHLSYVQKSGVGGYEIQPYTTNGTLPTKSIYLNYYLGANLNTGHTIGLYWHEGSRDSGSLWIFDGTDPYTKTISELDTANSFDYLGDVTLTFTRTLRKGLWNTLCLPFNLSKERIEKTFGSDCKIRQFTSVAADGTTMKFTPATEMKAGVPYLVNPAADKTNPSFYCTILRDTAPMAVVHGGYQMVGTYGVCTLTTDGTQLFLTAENLFKKPINDQNNANKLKGLRAYFEVPSGTNASALRAIVSDDDVTAIDSVNAGGTDAHAPVYDLQGRRVGTALSALRPGVYICGGKKYVVK